MSKNTKSAQVKEVVYSGLLNYWNGRTYPDGATRQWSGVGFGEDTLEATQTRLDYYLQYYSDLGYEIKEYKITAECKNCQGTGEISTGKRFGHRKPCPVCKGKPEIEVITEWAHWRVLRGSQ